MKRNILYTILLLLLFSRGFSSLAQADSQKQHLTVAIFTPLYLDSAFDTRGDYKYGKQFPKFINPGLEFYEGIQMAIDSLNAEKLTLDVHVFDTRSAKQTLQQQLNDSAMNNAGLIIGHVTPTEQKVIADMALRKNIPFINANLPTDAGISNNASLVILNSTLKTHCEGIYRFLQKNYPTSPIVVFRRKGVQEDRLKTYLTDYEKSTAGVPLKMKYVLLDENNIGDLSTHFDSTRQGVALVGSLDENFGRAITVQLAALSKSYPIVLVGMPTWEGIDFTRKEYKGLEIIYSTPFYNAKTDKTSTGITNYFTNVMYSRPSEMVFRGYECMYRFGKLLAEKGNNLNSAIGEKKYKVFTDLDIQPVINKQTMTLDYFENKKLYFVKKVDGVIKQVL
jgi:hypothetical protein